MSYILDALRRAQAERERGEVPGLDAQPVPPPVPAPGGSVPNRWLATGLVLLFLGALALAFAAWWSRPGERVVPAPAAVPPSAQTSSGAPSGAARETAAGSAAAAAAQAPTAPRDPATLTTAQTTPQTTTNPSSDLVASPPPGLPAGAISTPALPIVVSAAPGTTAGAVAQAAAGASPGMAPSGGPAAVPAALPLEQVPAARRRELPPLAVGGSVWSENAATRFVIIDGQLLREGDRLNAQLVLERIAPRAAVLRWREDQRIELRW